MSDTVAHKVKFALPEAFTAETDSSTQTQTLQPVGMLMLTVMPF